MHLSTDPLKIYQQLHPSEQKYTEEKKHQPEQPKEKLSQLTDEETGHDHNNQVIKVHLLPLKAMRIRHKHFLKRQS